MAVDTTRAPAPRMLRGFRRFDASAVLVGAVCLAVQLAYLAEGTDDPTFEVPIVDAGVYHDAAMRFAAGEPLFGDAFWQPPLFPILLGCLYRVAGPSILIAKLVLAGLATLTCLLVCWIGRRVFSRRVGVAAGLILALYGPFVFFSTRLLPTGLAVFLDVMALALWLRCIERPHWRRWLLFGLMAGVATITVPNAAVLPVIAVIGSVMSKPTTTGRPGIRGALIACCATAIGVIVPIGSVTVRNYLVSGDLITISTNGGINFFIGNNPHSDKTVAIRPGENWKRLVRRSYREDARTRAQQSAYFFWEGLSYLTDHPLGFLRGIVRKTIRLINAREIPRNVDPYVHRDHSHLLSTLMWRAGPFAFPFGLVAPLAAVGVVVTLASGPRRFDDLRNPIGARSASDGTNESPLACTRGSDQTCGNPVSFHQPEDVHSTCPSDYQRTGRLALLAFIVAYGASIVLFFVSSRYRLPIATVMTLFAAAGAVWIWDQLRGRCWRRDRGLLCAGFAAFVISSMMVNVPINAPTDGVNFRAEMAMCVGHAHASRGRFDEAQQHLRHALDLDPHYTAAAAKLAGVLVEHNRLDEAEKLLRDALPWDEQSTEAGNRLGRLLHTRGRTTEAVAIFQDALTIDPTSPEAHAGLADAFFDANRIDEAVDHYQQAVELADNQGPVLIRLADALVRREDYAEAIERYRQGLWLIEPESVVLNRVAWLLATCPVVELRDCERAIEIAEHLCRITDYKHPVAMDTLAAAYAECGRWADAVTFVRHAIDTAIADNDPKLADSFRPRLEIYEDHLSRQIQSPTESSIAPLSDKP